MQANDPGGDISAKDSFNVNLIHLKVLEALGKSFYKNIALVTIQILLYVFGRGN